MRSQISTISPSSLDFVAVEGVPSSVFSLVMFVSGVAGSVLLLLLVFRFVMVVIVMFDRFTRYQVVKRGCNEWKG